MGLINSWLGIDIDYRFMIQDIQLKFIRQKQIANFIGVSRRSYDKLFSWDITTNLHKPYSFIEKVYPLHNGGHA